MTDKATPRPWKRATSQEPGDAPLKIVDAHGEMVFGFPDVRAENDDLTTLIVRAVNRDALFDECVEALKRARNQIVAWALNELGPDRSGKQVKYIDDLLARIEEMEP